MLVYPKNYALRQFWVEKLSKFQQNSTKLPNEALIRKLISFNFSYTFLSSDNINIEYVYMLVGPNFKKMLRKLHNEALIIKKVGTKVEGNLI